MLKKDKKIVKVEFYSGYKGEETPRAVWIDNREYQVREVVWRKRIRDQESDRMVEAFKVKIDGETLIIERSETGECLASRSQD